jgi:hypothetical protein|tara:strand:- start:2522 stop:2785 length:264 start_codon:yes stop_codon:yes gene_type:complete
MIKELRIFFYLIIIFLFIFLVLKFYFSDDNKKNSYRSLKQIDKKIIIYSQNLFLLKSDTKNIVEYIERNISKNKKNYNFWKLLNNDN